jgi:transcriptional regulator GlxA family with amidase domain
VSPHRYVVQCRVIRAQELLATTQLSLTEIALTSGFADHSHFSRRFHQLMGIAPREFRNCTKADPAYGAGVAQAIVRLGQKGSAEERKSA